jgi:hypothetical protein
VVCIVSAGYIVDHYCLMFDRGAVHIVAVKPQKVMDNNITATTI